MAVTVFLTGFFTLDYTWQFTSDVLSSADVGGTSESGTLYVKKLIRKTITA